MRKVSFWVRLTLCLALLATLGYLAFEISTRSATHQIRKYDHANITHMKYSLFNVNLWKKKLVKVVVSEIQKFKINDGNREALKKHMEKQLDVLIDKVNEQVRQSNKDSTKGWFRQAMMDMLVDVEAVKQGIPSYADAIVDKLTDAETQAQLKTVIKEKVSEYMKKTYEVEDTRENDLIVARMGVKDIDEARKILAETVPRETAALFDLTWKFLAVAIVLFALAAIHRGRIPAVFFFVCWWLLLILLYIGVTTPMIDMDARIPKFGFMLMGYQIEFIDQTVYYQSKSILDVFWLMIQHSKPEMKFVGVLLVLFSIVFPVLKLTFSIIYYYDVFGLRKNWFIRAIVLKSGKWSMADVMAVAILMAFIGFNGMITTQLEAMRATFPEAIFISTNGTTLQIGLYAFVAYVVLSIFFSLIISKDSRTLTK